MTHRPPRAYAEYDLAVRAFDEHGVADVPGDILEIGCFEGGGTALLGRWAAHHGKKLYAIDPFDPTTDTTPDAAGRRMADLYVALLEGQNQRALYNEAIRGVADSVVTIEARSTEAELPEGLRLCAAFVDGSHDPETLRFDFRLVLGLLSPGGVAVFDDYWDELPSVRDTLSALVAEHAGEIRRVEPLGERSLMVVRR